MKHIRGVIIMGGEIVNGRNCNKRSRSIDLN